MRYMDLSVIIPALNEEKYIENCLKALKNQNFKGKYEIIVSDGGSKDRTVKIAKKYAKIIVDKDRTIAAGRQKGVEVSKGKILVFTDADCRPSKRWLQEIIKPLNNGAIGCHGTIIPYDGEEIEKKFCKNVFPKYSELMIKLKRPASPGSNFAVRREAFEAIGGFDTELVTGEDVDLAKRIAKIGKFVFNPKAIVYVSARRVKCWGKGKYIKYYLMDSIKSHVFGKHCENYPAIR